MKAPVLAVLGFLAGIVPTVAQSYRFNRVVGEEFNSPFRIPAGIAVDSAGNVYVSSSNSHTIQKVTPSGGVITLAGTDGIIGSADGSGSAARFYVPSGLAIDRSGNLYVADMLNNTIRKISPTGAVTTLAGVAGDPAYADGPRGTARFYYPKGVAVDDSGNVYVCDSRTIRKVTPAGDVTTLAGDGANAGSVIVTKADGIGSAAQLIEPNGIAVDREGNNLYVTQADTNTIRRVTIAGVVTTLAGKLDSPGNADGIGSAARFSRPWGIAVDRAGDLIVTDIQERYVRKITSAGEVTTLAGKTSGLAGADAVAVDDAGNIHVVDSYSLYKGVPVAEPVITVPPPINQSAAIGFSVSIRVSITGLGPLAFQWLKDGAAVPGATNATLALSQVRLADAGTYVVVASNSTGRVISPPVALQVALPYTLTDLGTLGGQTSRATGVNAAGQVVGSAQTTAGAGHAFLFSGGAMIDLGTLGGAESNATAINAAGQVAGWSEFRAGSRDTHAFLLSGRTMSDLGALGGTNSRANAINDLGHVVGWSDTDAFQLVGLARITESHAFIHTGGTMNDLGRFGYTGSSARAINFAGQIAGTLLSGSGGTATWLAYDAFLFSANRLSILGRLASEVPPYLYGCDVNAVNSAGQVVGWANIESRTTAFLSEEGRLIDIGTLGSGENSAANGINAAGSIVGESGTSRGTRAFLFESGALFDLNELIPGAPGWILRSASAINDRGQIVGTGTSPAGATRAFLLTPADTTTSRLRNVSVLAELGAGEAIVVGFATQGGPRPLLIRGVGPGLSPFLSASSSVAGDPLINVYQTNGARIGSNDNWSSGDASATNTLTNAFRTVGAFPLAAGSLDAALLQTIEGNPTAQLTASSGGLALLEVYDPVPAPATQGSAATSARLSNFSAHARIAGGSSLIVGFTIDGSGPRTILIRGIGPGLAAAPLNVAGALGDPKLEVYSGFTQKIAENDDWVGGLAATFAQVGAFALPVGSKDASLVLALPPGIYTVRLANPSGTPGTGLVEVYEVP